MARRWGDGGGRDEVRYDGGSGGAGGAGGGGQAVLLGWAGLTVCHEGGGGGPWGRGSLVITTDCQCVL